MVMIGFDPVEPDSQQRPGEPTNGDVRSVLIQRVVAAGQIVFNVAIRHQEACCRRQYDRIPLEVGRLEGGSVNLLLVFEYSLRAAVDDSVLLIRIPRDI